MKSANRSMTAIKAQDRQRCILTRVAPVAVHPLSKLKDKTQHPEQDALVQLPEPHRPFPLLTWLPGLALACPLVVLAQAPTEQEQPSKPQSLQKVQVQGSATALSQQRNSTAALTLVPREELLRHGDTRLADALRRVPGLTVVSGGSRGPEIRMAGLGGGYTQILLNGEPVPPGFSLETLSPELIERVEVSRSASVEQSSQAIAGSINIVLRRQARAGQRDVKLSASTLFGRPSLSADVQLGDRSETLNWGLGVGVASEKQIWPMFLTQRSLGSNQATTQAYNTVKTETDHTLRLTLAPRATWTLSPKESLSTDHLLRLFKSVASVVDQRESLFGPRPDMADNTLTLRPHGLQLRSRLNWTRSDEDGSKWELKLGLTRQDRRSKADLQGFDFDERWVLDERVNSTAVDQGLSLSGRWRKPWREAHTLSTGWDSEDNRRHEDRLQRVMPLPGGLAMDDLDEVYQAKLRRLAVFVQDEWELGPQWSATLGLRWESLDTRSEGNVFEGVHSRSSVFSPVLQALWKLPGGKDQLRLGLARSYKAPTPRELMPRRYVANNNSATTPDWQGNPNLRPELAWGLDLGYSHALGKASQWGVSSYLKRIEQVIADELFLQDGHWVLRRANLGLAWVAGLELEAKLSLPELQAGAPAIDVRANLAVNRSRLDAVPGPDNRLAQQIPISLSLGLDHRVKALPLSWGASFSFQGGGPLRQAENRFGHQSIGRVLDVYGHWKLDARRGWRLALSNLLHPDKVEQRRVLAEGLEHRLSDRWRSGVKAQLSYEQSL